MTRGRLVGCNKLSLYGGKLHFHAPIRSIVYVKNIIGLCLGHQEERRVERVVPGGRALLGRGAQRPRWMVPG